VQAARENLGPQPDRPPRLVRGRPTSAPARFHAPAVVTANLTGALLIETAAELLGAVEMVAPDCQRTSGKRAG
jgi:hypothetical protein